MLQKLLNLTKRKWLQVLGALGGAPARYWNYLLIAGFLALIGVFAADTLIFMKMRDGAFGEVFLPENIGVKLVDRASLEAAAMIVEERQRNFEAALVAPIPRDPGQ